MSSSKHPPPSQNPRDSDAPKPPSLSIQEALEKANRERFANLTSSGPPGTTPQPRPSSNPPNRFVNPQDVEKTDVSKFWRAGENKDERNGDFLRQSQEMRKQKQKQKEKENVKATENVPKKKENASVGKDMGGGEEVEQVDDAGELQPEPASPQPPRKEPNEWKWLKGIEAGLPARRSSTHWNNTDNNGQ